MFSTGCHLVVMAKAPRPGQVKTRLAVTRGDRVATALAHAFLLDTWRGASTLAWATPVIAGDGPDMGIPGATVWPQGTGDLGARLERVARRALQEGERVIIIGSDTPGLPLLCLEAARDALARSDAVLGPSQDGGFYLLGLRGCPSGLLAGLPWSCSGTHERTRDQLRAHGLEVVELMPWFDVDEEADLLRLRELIEAGLVEAPATHALLRSLG